MISISRRSAALASAAALGASVLTLSVTAHPAHAAQCAVDTWTNGDKTGTHVQYFPPSGQAISVSPGVKSAHASTGCTSPVVFQDAQQATTVTLTGGTDALFFDYSIYMGFNLGNHNEIVLEG